MESSSVRGYIIFVPSNPDLMVRASTGNLGLEMVEVSSVDKAVPSTSSLGPQSSIPEPRTTVDNVATFKDVNGNQEKEVASQGSQSSTASEFETAGEKKKKNKVSESEKKKPIGD